MSGFCAVLMRSCLVFLLTLLGLFHPVMAENGEDPRIDRGTAFLVRISSFMTMKSYSPDEVGSVLGVKFIYSGSGISIDKEELFRSYEGVPGSIEPESPLFSGRWANPSYAMSRGDVNRISVDVLINVGYACISESNSVKILAARRSNVPATDGGGWSYSVANERASIDLLGFRNGCASIIVMTFPQIKGWSFPSDAEAESAENIDLHSPREEILKQLSSVGFECVDGNESFFSCSSGVVDKYGRFKGAVIGAQAGKITFINVNWGRK